MMNIKIDQIENKVLSIFGKLSKKGFDGYEIYQKDSSDKKATFEPIKLDTISDLFNNNTNKIVEVQFYNIERTKNGSSIEYILYNITSRLGKNNKLLGLELIQL